MRLKEMNSNDVATLVAIEEMGEPTNRLLAERYVSMAEGLTHLNGRHPRINRLFDEVERVRLTFDRDIVRSPASHIAVA
jgi:hypothetical protein